MKSLLLFVAPAVLIAGASVAALDSKVLTPRDRLPNGFIALDSKLGPLEQQIINTQQILELTSYWDPKIPQNKKTKRNAKWTMIKMSDRSVLIIKDTLPRVLNTIRNQQQ